jgi:hypothetical protein
MTTTSMRPAEHDLAPSPERHAALRAFVFGKVFGKVLLQTDAKEC